jgi:hypothetical protein
MSAFWAMAMPLLVAVNGPMVEGVDGTIRGTPAGGTGLGIGTSKVNGPVGIEAGVAPAASIAADAFPLREVFPMAAAAWAIVAGNGTWDW